MADSGTAAAPVDDREPDVDPHAEVPPRGGVSSGVVDGRPSTPPDRREGGWTLRKRADVLFGVALAVVVIAAATAALALLNLLETREQVSDRLDPARVASGDLLSGLFSQQQASRGALVSGGDEQFYDLFASGEQQEAEAIAHMRGLLDDAPRLQDHLDQIEADAQRWRDDHASSELQAGRRQSDLTREEREANVRAFDVVQEDVEALQAELETRREEGRSDLDRATALLVSSLAVAIVVLALLVLLMRTAATRWVIRPLDRLRLDARSVAAGDLQHPVIPQGPDELAELGADVDAMRRRLLSELQLLEETHATLADQAEELARSNRDLEQFAYVASHDLREPLRKVTAFCELLQSRYGGQLDERADTYIGFAVDGAQRMEVLINDLLAFSRVGRLTADFEPVDCDDCLDRALDNLSMTLEDAGAVVERQGELPTVDGDATLLTAVFQNLVANAIKFRRPDVPPQVQVTAVRRDDEWEITVTDNGIGIEPEYAERVFIIFQRLHTKEAYSGTGIGLALCRKIIEHHGGRIWVDTDRSEGTRVAFTLPAARIS
jgi:signal transduction histidine kinase